LGLLTGVGLMTINNIGNDVSILRCSDRIDDTDETRPKLCGITMIKTHHLNGYKDAS